MRLWLTALPATILVAGTALSQAPTPNAIGLWRSSGIVTTGIGFLTVPAGTTGLSVWQVLPPDVLTYFRPAGAGGLRQLDFRGLEFKMFRQAGTTATIPQIDLSTAVQAAAPNEGRYVPGAGVLASFPSQAWTFGNNVITQLQYINATPVAVPAGTTAGQGLAARYVDYCSTGGVNQKTLLVYTTNESAGPALNGINAGTGDLFIEAAGPFPTHETTTSFLFNQSMIQPIKNSTLTSGGSALLGGGTVPAGVFNFVSDDGRGGLKPSGGETLSYLANSNATASPAVGNAWVIPFVMVESDVAFGTNPAPENWVGNGGSPELAYIHKMSLQKWIDDILTLGLGLPTGSGIGAVLNPNNSSLGLWLGADLPAFSNLIMVLNSFLFTNPNVPSYAGPELTMFDSVNSPTSIIGRNLVNLGTKIAENKHWGTPQTGWTVVVGGAPPVVGFGANPGGASVAGLGFYVNCWVYDFSSPTNPTGAEIVDVTNVIKYTLQP